MLNRRILVAIAFSLITVWIFQYFTGKKTPQAGAGGPVEQGQVQPGQVYSIPQQKATWHSEPKREVDFLDADLVDADQDLITVKTPLYIIKFSNLGGIIQSLSFKKHKGQEGTMLQTISSDPVEQREEGCFLLGLDEKTPYQYKLISKGRRDSVQEVVYQTQTSDWVIKKTYTIHDTSYKIDLKFDFEPRKSNAAPFMPRIFFPAPTSLQIAETQGAAPHRESDIMSSAFFSKDGVRVSKISNYNELSSIWGLPEIFGAEDKYFAHTLIKDEKNFSQGAYLKRVNKKLLVILEGEKVTGKKTWDVSFYMGPKLLKPLTSVDPRLEDLLSFGILSWFCKLLLKFLDFLYKHLHNFGLAIIVLTILLKIPFLPLSISSRRKMEEYQKYQPTINRIRQKYKTDLRKQQSEIMIFHKQHNLSAATPMMGCLPLLIQLPILFSLYRVLGNYLSLYQAPFFGWIVDLSVKDPYYVLPILMGLTMLWQQKMSPVTDEKQRLMMLFMPVVMTAIFINFPSGLVLYWLTNNFLTVGEDFLRKKVFS